MKTEQQAKRVQVIRTWIFNKIDRVCFQVRSSKSTKIYHTCFDKGHASCTCPAGVKSIVCYHVTQLRPRYEAIKAERAAKRDRARAAYVATFDPCLVD